MMKRIRQYVGILAALVVYYVIHEGAHLVMALIQGVFKEVKFMGLGMQIDVFRDRMTDTQLGWFCLAGAVATFLTGWILVLLCRKICAMESKVLKALFWYVTIALLVLDPLYLSVLCGFFGGGDMNGIRLLMPEVVARILFAIIGVIHVMVIWKYLLPKYKESFNSRYFGKETDNSNCVDKTMSVIEIKGKSYTISLMCHSQSSRDILWALSYRNATAYP